MLALVVVATGACSSSAKTASRASSSSAAPSTLAAALPSGAANAGLTLVVTGDLTGTTDPLSTKVSRCTAMGGQFVFDGTVSLGGTELDVKISTGPDASVEISDLVGGRSWSAPNTRDASATVSITADSPTTGSLTVIAVRDAGGQDRTASAITRLELHGTYRC